MMPLLMQALCDSFFAGPARGLWYILHAVIADYMLLLQPATLLLFLAMQLVGVTGGCHTTA